MRQLLTVIVLVLLAVAASRCSILDPCNSPNRWIFVYSDQQNHEVALGESLIFDLRDRAEIITTSGSTDCDVLDREPLTFDSLAVADPTVANVRVVHGTDLSITGLRPDTTTYVIYLSGNDLYDTAGANRRVSVDLHGTVIVGA